MTQNLSEDRDSSAGFGQRLDIQGPLALLMVDMSLAYFTRGSPLDLADDALLERAALLLSAARAARIPVLHSRVEYDADGINGGLFFRKIGALRVFCAGSPLAAFAAPLAPVAGEVVVTKQYASAFFGTSLASTLRTLRVQSLLISGVSTSGCVRATAVDALQHGFVPLVVRDAVGDRQPAPHEASLFDLAAKYAEVVGLDEARALLGPRS